MKIEDYKEAFEILAEYQPDAGPQPVHPQHEKVRIFVDPGEVPDGEIERLEELGVHAEPSHTVEGPPHFYIFT